MIERMIIILERIIHCLLGILRFIFNPEIPVKTPKIPDTALSTALAITKNLGADRLSFVVVKIKTHITTNSKPEIARKMLDNIKKTERLFFIK